MLVSFIVSYCFLSVHDMTQPGNMAEERDSSTTWPGEKRGGRHLRTPGQLGPPVSGTGAIGEHPCPGQNTGYYLGGCPSIHGGRGRI